MAAKKQSDNVVNDMVNLGEDVGKIKKQDANDPSEELKKRGFKQPPSNRIITVDEYMQILIHNYNVIIKEIQNYNHPPTDL